VYGGTFWLGPLLQDHVPYDVVKDFAPITLAASSPNVLVVNPSLPVKTVKDLIGLARSRPGDLNYASSAAGSSPHLAAELFKALAAVNIVRIPYKGVGQAVTDLIAGQVQVMFGNAATVGQHLKSGKLRALAVTSAQPSVFFPDMPTIAASGVPGYESGAMFGAFAPAKTPAAIVNQLYQESVQVLTLQDVKERFFKTGLEVVASSPENFANKVKSEMARIGKVIKDAGIRAE
jgi:tripartite-type tricarboxylate transporter receptor subunit TctC